MSTDAQIAANRLNAQKSTGPRTPRGKARAALNALKHGLRAQVILARSSELEGDDPSPFARLLSDLVAELAPVGVCESFCVETMAVATWRLRLVIHKEYDLAGQPDADNLADALADVNDEIRAWTYEQDPSTPEPEPVPRPAPHPTMPHPDKFLPIMRYEAHLMRQYNQAFRQLEHLRAARPDACPPPSEPTPPTEPLLPDEPPPVSPSCPPATPPAASAPPDLRAASIPPLVGAVPSSVNTSPALVNLALAPMSRTPRLLAGAAGSHDQYLFPNEPIAGLRLAAGPKRSDIYRHHPLLSSTPPVPRTLGSAIIPAGCSAR